MKIAVLTDSSAYLSKEQQEKYHIDVVPIPLIWDGKTYYDLVDIGYEEFYEKISSSETLPTTSQPALGQIMEFVDRYVKEGYTDVIVLPLSSGLSSSYSTLVNYAAEEDRIKIHPFDCRITCAGLADCAILAARLANAGASVDLIMKDLEDLRKTIGVRFLVDNLAHLKRTGRLSNAASFIGTLLHITPILTMDVQKTGHISAIAKERHYKRAYKHIQEDFRDLTENKDYPIQAAILDAASPERGKEWLDDYCKTFPKDKFYRTIIGPVVGVHCGKNTIAIIWCRDLDSYFDENGQPLENVESAEVGEKF
ncbi:DegV family protein [Lactobacillus sp.]|uniref:DegV family protein n=1 Tax=Lactobacillus sp. TaxID=1591 RepID=UPI003F03D168